MCRKLLEHRIPFMHLRSIQNFILQVARFSPRNERAMSSFDESKSNSNTITVDEKDVGFLKLFANGCCLIPLENTPKKHRGQSFSKPNSTETMLCTQRISFQKIQFPSLSLHDFQNHELCGLSCSNCKTLAVTKEVWLAHRIQQKFLNVFFVVLSAMPLSRKKNPEIDRQCTTQAHGRQKQRQTQRDSLAVVLHHHHALQREVFFPKGPGLCLRHRFLLGLCFLWQI